MLLKEGPSSALVPQSIETHLGYFRRLSKGPGSTRLWRVLLVGDPIPPPMPLAKSATLPPFLGLPAAKHGKGRSSGETGQRPVDPGTLLGLPEIPLALAYLSGIGVQPGSQTLSQTALNEVPRP
jgi:hypothetical protein